MSQITRYFFMPTYEFLCQACGGEMNHKIVDKYPAGISVKVCPHCKKEFKMRFFPNDKGVMTLELREVKR